MPALAAPHDWQGLSPDSRAIDATGLPALRDPMPFEERGWSFPGAAFYYLQDTPQQVAAGQRAIANQPAGAFDPLAHWNGDPARAIEVHSAGPAARAFSPGGTGLDKARALQCLASAVYYEAASESLGGQKAVAQVVLNRVAHPAYPRTVCGVVFQGSERRTGCQFSFTCDGSLDRKPSRVAWARALMVARQALSGEVYAPVGLATHYHTTWVNPYWAGSLDNIGTIGAHRFYRWRGAAGRADAFGTAYVGGEPLPRARDTAPVVASLAGVDAADPVALARAYEEAKRKAEAEAASVGARAASPTAVAGPPAPPPPNYTQRVEEAGGDAQFRAQALPGSGTVKPEYESSGRWIAPPR